MKKYSIALATLFVFFLVFTVLTLTGCPPETVDDDAHTANPCPASCECNGIEDCGQEACRCGGDGEEGTCEDGVHKVVAWTTTLTETNNCTRGIVQEGICTECGETATRTLSASFTSHDFSDAFADNGNGTESKPCVRADCDQRLSRPAYGIYTLGDILLQTRWGANASPYNMFHHITDAGTRSRVGCNHFATSQIMKYHEWPQTITGNIPAYTTGHGMNMPEIVRNNFSYDWANMKNTYARDEEGPAAKAVATLVYHVSLSNRGNYTIVAPGGGGASARNVALSLKQNFNYDNSIRFMRRDGRYLRTGDHQGIGGTWNVSRDSILPDIWDEILRLQIDRRLPVFYWGNYDDMSDGHAFVIDGYNDSGLFHINMGHGGSRDGWYSTTGINYGSTNLNLNQMAIFNIMRDLGGGGTPDLRIFGRDLRTRLVTGESPTTEVKTVDNGELFFVNPTIYNIGTATSPAGKILGIALYDSSDQFIEIIGQAVLDETQTLTRARETGLTAAQKRQDFTFEVWAKVSADVPAGNYIIRAVWLDGGPEPVQTINHYKNEAQITVSGNQDDGSFLTALDLQMVSVEGFSGGNFSIGKFEVTQRQWKFVMGEQNNPSHFRGDDLPVERVSWSNVQNFISRLNEMTGMRFRLPTEEEWAYAASGGHLAATTTYAGSNDADEVAWYGDGTGESTGGNSGGTTHPVGSKLPNELGIYDMSGNVAEWVLERDNGTATNRIRGGSWFRPMERSRINFRDFHGAVDSIISTSNYVGFRLLLVLE